MSVVPMKLLTMAGPLERFDEVVRTCVIDQQFHPESTLQMMHGVKGLMALDYSNPYAALLRRAEEVADEAGVPLDYAPFDPSLDSDGLSAYFDQLEQEMLSLKRRQQTLQQQAEESRTAAEQLENLRGLGTDLDELWGLDYVRFRYGWMPRETFDSFQVTLNDEEDIFFFPTTLGSHRVYGVYFTTQEAHRRVDTLFNSLHFTRIHIDVQPHGTAEAAIAALGRQAEHAMLAATGGVNTHKGALYSFALLLSALGQCLAEGGDPFDTAAAIAAALPPAENTHGSAVRAQCGGVRQEAVSGFPTARHMRGLLESAGPLSALVWAMSRLDDSTLVYRGGPQGLAYVRRRAAELLRLPEEALPPALEALDDDLMARRLSPGGSADLLALTLFFRSLDFWTELSV